jgi:hypothetical protein
MVIALPLVARWGWGARGRAALEEELRRLGAAGEPTVPGDFDTPAPPDAENAFADLRAAAAGVDERSAAWVALGELPRLGLQMTEVEAAAVDAVVAECAGALASAERAADKPLVHFPRACLRIDEADGPAAWSRPANVLPRLLGVAALRAHAAGDEALALRRCRAILAVARGVDHAPGLFPHGAADRIREDACGRVFQIAPDLAASDDAVAREELRKLIAELTDDAGHRAAFVRAIRGERVIDAEFVAACGRGERDVFGALLTPIDDGGESWALRGRRWLLQPVAWNDGPIVVRHYGRMIAAAEAAAGLPAFVARVPGSRAAEALEHPFLHAVAWEVTRSFSLDVRRHYQCATARHLAATALAIRSWAAEHDGRLPDSLGVLSIPVQSDPMAAGGSRLRYLPRAGDPIVYSVGGDGVDQGGDVTPNNPRWPVRAGDLWGTRDAVLHVGRRSGGGRRPLTPWRTR